MKKSLKICGIMTVFILGLLFTLTYKHKDLIEGFESKGDELDSQNISREGNDKIKDVEVQDNNKSKRAGNFIDKLLNQKKIQRVH